MVIVLLLTILMMKQLNYVTKVKRNELEQLGDDSEGNDRRADNHSLSNKLPTNVEFAWTKVDLEHQNYQNIPELRKQDELVLPLALLELFFDEELVYQIAEFTILYGKREKADSTFEFLNEKFRLFLAILLLTGYYKLPERRMYWETILDTFVQAVSNAILTNSLERI